MTVTAVTARASRYGPETTVRELRAQFGAHVARGRRADLKIRTLLAETGSVTLREYVWALEAGAAAVAALAEARTP